MANNNEKYRNKISDIIDEIENEVSDIIFHCQSGNCTMNDIIDELKELEHKLY